MCGIFGVVGGHYERAAIQAAVDRVAHRGPDDAGIERLGTEAAPVWLGFRRLSILDLSPAGHQPMADAAGELWLVCNGEIYNYRELRRELEGRGHRFRSGTDTEVILYAYREWGIAAVERFVGMFAFGLWDARTEELFLVRDRLGIKPLYFHRTPQRLAFGSEIKSLLALPDVERTLDPVAVARFFNFLWVPPPGTLLQGVEQVEPGSIARYRRGRLDVHRYWDLPDGAVEPVTEAVAVDRLEALLETAVQDRMISDVPLGAFLSGGVDSSLIVAFMRRAGARGIITQTIAQSEADARYDIERSDLPYARRARDHFGDLDYHEIHVGAEATALLPKMVWHLDDPVADPAALSTYLVCRAAGERAKVMLSGMGGEEVFVGYNRHRAALLAERYLRIPRPLRRRVLEPAVARLPAAQPGPFKTFARNAKKFVWSADQDFDSRYLGYLSYYPPADLAALLVEAVPHAEVVGRHRGVLDRYASLDPVRRMSYLDLHTFLPGLNLAYTDRASMAASVEVRVPLLDHRVVEYAASLPADLKLRGSTQKYLLKEVASRHLPREIVHRPKTGFSAPVRAWVTRDLRPLIEEVLAPERLRARGVLRPEAVWRSIDETWRGREDHALRIWAFLTFELWAQTFLDGDGAAPLTL
jgi:asparagine synthase (glutamine-hydrolysing)